MFQVSGDDPVPHAEEDFTNMNLRDLLGENITHAGYRQPTPIQKHAIPILLSGRDLMACAQTGSGKTVSYWYFWCYLGNISIGELLFLP